MFRKAHFLTMVAIGTMISSAGSADYQPRRGNWDAILILDPGTSTGPALHLSLASYPATCTDALQREASKIEKSNGYVWTDKDFQVLSYKEEPGLADIKSEVIGLECVFKAWPKTEPGSKK